MGEVSVDDLLSDYLKEEELIRKEIRDLKIKLTAKRETIMDIADRVGRTINFPEIEDDTGGKKTSFEILPDTFFGKSHPDAAAQYLEMVGHAVHIDDILDALKKGGAAFTGNDPKGSLYTQLIRGTRRFVKIGDQAVFGLLEKYGNVKRSGIKTKAQKSQGDETQVEEEEPGEETED